MLMHCQTTGEDEVKCYNVNAATVLKDPLDSVNMHQLQEKDEAIGPVLRAMQSGTRVRPAGIQGRSQECYQLAEQWDQLTISWTEYCTDDMKMQTGGAISR